MAYALHQECVDELLGLAVRSGGVRPGADVL
jgi:hypothetical protein